MSTSAFVECAYLTGRYQCERSLSLAPGSGELPDYRLARVFRLRGWSVRLYGHGNTRCPEHKGKRHG